MGNGKIAGGKQLNVGAMNESHAVYVETRGVKARRAYGTKTIPDTEGRANR